VVSNIRSRWDRSSAAVTRNERSAAAGEATLGFHPRVHGQTTGPRFGDDPISGWSMRAFCRKPNSLLDETTLGCTAYPDFNAPSGVEEEGVYRKGEDGLFDETKGAGTGVVPSGMAAEEEETGRGVRGKPRAGWNAPLVTPNWRTYPASARWERCGRSSQSTTPSGIAIRQRFGGA
jgi:hypothetical protein